MNWDSFFWGIAITLFILLFSISVNAINFPYEEGGEWIDYAHYKVKNNDGTNTLYVGGAGAYKDENGNFTPIQLNILTSNSNTFDLNTNIHKFNVRPDYVQKVSETGDVMQTNIVALVGFRPNGKITILRNKANVGGNGTGSNLNFGGYINGIDLNYTISPTKVREEVIVQSATMDWLKLHPQINDFEYIGFLHQLPEFGNWDGFRLLNQDMEILSFEDGNITDQRVYIQKKERTMAILPEGFIFPGMSKQYVGLPMDYPNEMFIYKKYRRFFRYYGQRYYAELAKVKDLLELPNKQDIYFNDTIEYRQLSLPDGSYLGCEITMSDVDNKTTNYATSIYASVRDDSGGIPDTNQLISYIRFRKINCTNGGYIDCGSRLSATPQLWIRTQKFASGAYHTEAGYIDGRPLLKPFDENTLDYGNWKITGTPPLTIGHLWNAGGGMGCCWQSITSCKENINPAGGAFDTIGLHTCGGVGDGNAFTWYFNNTTGNKCVYGCGNNPDADVNFGWWITNIIGLSSSANQTGKRYTGGWAGNDFNNMQENRGIMWYRDTQTLGTEVFMIFFTEELIGLPFQPYLRIDYEPPCDVPTANDMFPLSRNWDLNGSETPVCFMNKNNMSSVELNTWNDYNRALLVYNGASILFDFTLDGNKVTLPNIKTGWGYLDFNGS